MEGGVGSLTIRGHGGSKTSRLGRILVDGNYILASANATGFGGTTYGNGSYRNNLFVRSTAPKDSGGGWTPDAMRNLVFQEERPDVANLMLPNEAINNTLLILWDDAQLASFGGNDPDDFVVFAEGGNPPPALLEATVQRNNLIRVPNSAEDRGAEYDPLSTTAAFTPRYLGYRHDGSVMDDFSATPAADVWELRPGVGSGAIGAATGHVPYRDYFRDARSTDTVGAVEPE